MTEKTRPAISVIVPVFNVEQYLPACLDSLLAQTLDGFEIIVVDDGSTDGSGAIIERYARAHANRVTAYTKPNGGLGDARNFGLERATGEYLAFVDSDDTVVPTMLEKLLAAAQDTGAEMVVCGIQRFADGEADSLYIPEPDLNAFGHSLAEEPRLLFRVDASACDKLYASALFDRADVRFPVGLAFEDVPTVFVLAASANRIEKIDDPLYRYRRGRIESITGSYGAHFLDLVEAFELLGKRLEALGPPGRLDRDAFLRLHLTHLIAGRYPDFFLRADAGSRARFLSAVFRLLDARFAGWRGSPVCRDLWPGEWLRFISTHRLALVLFSHTPQRLYLSALRRMGAFDPRR